jgi:surface antigen
VSLKETEGTIGEMPSPMWLGDDIKYSYTGYLFRMTQYMMFTLNREEKKMHESAVFFALNNAENGKIVSWYSKERLAAGKVRVIHSYPISGGYCRTYQAYIKINGKARHMTNNACKKISIRRWSFYK